MLGAFDRSLRGSERSGQTGAATGGGMSSPLNRRVEGSGWPAWTRTMNNGSKGRCVTITPQASDENITWLKWGAGASLGIVDLGFWIWPGGCLATIRTLANYEAAVRWASGPYRGGYGCGQVPGAKWGSGNCGFGIWPEPCCAPLTQGQGRRSEG